MKSSTVSQQQRVLFNSIISSGVYIKAKCLGREFRCDKVSRFIIYAIFFINLLFITVHCSIEVLKYFNLADEIISDLKLKSGRFHVDRDRSFAEWFNYLQATMCMALLLGVFRTTRQPLYAAWALIFLFVVMDDSLKIHEGVAFHIVSAFGVPALPGLRPQASGELLVWAVVGSLLLGILCWGFARSGRGARAAGGVLGLAFAALVFFGIGIDMIHSAFSRSHAVVSALLAVLEDGGEMLSIGLACALALLLYRHPALAR